MHHQKDGKGQNQDEKNVEKRCWEEKICQSKAEDLNGKMLGKEVHIHRATNYGLDYIGHGMPTFDEMEFVRSK